jgi:hypothetical protein
MSDIDLSTAADVLARLDEPTLERELRETRESAPDLPTERALDLALSIAIARLGYELNRQTFEFLKWKVIVARETTRRTLAASRAAADAARLAEETGEADAASQDRLSRCFTDDEAVVWTVTEIAGNSLALPGRRCLIFASGAAARRVWSYPADWRTLDAEELVLLSRRQ